MGRHNSPFPDPRRKSDACPNYRRLARNGGYNRDGRSRRFARRNWQCLGSTRLPDCNTKLCFCCSLWPDAVEIEYVADGNCYRSSHHRRHSDASSGNSGGSTMGIARTGLGRLGGRDRSRHPFHRNRILFLFPTDRQRRCLERDAGGIHHASNCHHSWRYRAGRDRGIKGSRGRCSYRAWACSD